jgi:ferredoxin
VPDHNSGVKEAAILPDFSSDISLNIRTVDSSIITLTITDREGATNQYEAPTDMNMNLMEVCKAHELPVKGTCGGMALCASCHVYILSDHELPEMSADEEAQLDQAFFVKNNSRLGCQIRITPEMDGIVVQLAPESE